MIPIGDESPTRRVPIVTWSLVAINSAIFLVCLSGGFAGVYNAAREWGFIPAHFSIATLFTSMFLHGGIFHVVGNMLYLWIFGDNVEDSFGHVGFLALYLGAGLAAGLCHYASDTASGMPTVGASGAISGVLGAYILLYPHNRIKVLWWWYWYVRVFRIAAVWFLGLYFVLQIVMVSIAGGYTNVAHWAHIGGFVAGLAVTAVLMALKVVQGAPRPVRVRAGSPLERAAAEAGVLDQAAVRRVDLGPATSAIVTSRVVDSGKLPLDPSRRLQDIMTALSAGEPQKAVRLAQLELRIPAKAAAEPWALAQVADAFYQKEVYPLSFRLHKEVLRRMPEGDARLPEIKFRAGIIAARNLGDHNAAKELLSDVVRTHGDSGRVRLAQRELARIEANLVRTGLDEDVALLEGPCAVIRQTSGMVNVPEVGRLVSGIAGIPLADATRLLRSSVGFVGSGLPPVKAKQLAVRLQEMDIPVLVIPEEKLVALPNAAPLGWAAALPAELQMRTEDGVGLSKGYGEVFYASCGLVCFRTRKRVVDELSAGGPTQRYMPIGLGHGVAVPISAGPNYIYKEVQSEKLVFDVFTLDPFACYRMIEDKLDFRETPHAVTVSAHLNFRRLVSDFVASGRGVPVNEGARLVAADSPQREWREMTFNSIADFERYNYWRLQLEQYG